MTRRATAHALDAGSDASFNIQDDQEPPLKKLAILAEREEDKYVHDTVLKCLACGGLELPDLMGDPKVCLRFLRMTLSDHGIAGFRAHRWCHDVNVIRTSVRSEGLGGGHHGMRAHAYP